MAKVQKDEQTETGAAGTSTPGPRRGQKVESTFADKWDPVNEGDELEGRYLGSELAPGKNGEMFRVYHIEAPDTKRWSVAGAHLDSIMQQIPRNTYVWVMYKGEVLLKNKNKMKLYDVSPEEGTKLIDTYTQKT